MVLRYLDICSLTSRYVIPFMSKRYMSKTDLMAKQASIESMHVLATIRSFNGQLHYGKFLYRIMLGFAYRLI